MRKTLIADSSVRPANVDECPSAKISLFDYFFDAKRKVWTAYDWTVPKYIHDANLKFNEIFVPTAHTMRINQILNLLSNVRIDYILYSLTNTFAHRLFVQKQDNHCLFFFKRTHKRQRK